MKGQNLRVLIGNPAKCVAFAQTCSYHISANLESKETKDDTDQFQRQEVTGLAGDISCDALYSVEPDASGLSGMDALDMVLAGEEVDVEFSPTTGSQNRDATGVKYTCKALVNDININAANKAEVTYSIQMQMNSKPTKVSSN